MPSITPVDWAIVGALVVGALTMAAKWLLPALRVGNGHTNGNAATAAQEAEWRGEVKSILQMQSATLSALAANVAKLTEVTTEIERRSRGSEEAIRKVLDRL